MFSTTTPRLSITKTTTINTITSIIAITNINNSRNYSIIANNTNTSNKYLGNKTNLNDNSNNNNNINNLHKLAILSSIQWNSEMHRGVRNYSKTKKARRGRPTPPRIPEALKDHPYDELTTGVQAKLFIDDVHGRGIGGLFLLSNFMAFGGVYYLLHWKLGMFDIATSENMNYWLNTGGHILFSIPIANIYSEGVSRLIMNTEKAQQYKMKKEEEDIEKFGLESDDDENEDEDEFEDNSNKK